MGPQDSEVTRALRGTEVLEGALGQGVTRDFGAELDFCKNFPLLLTALKGLWGPAKFAVRVVCSGPRHQSCGLVRDILLHRSHFLKLLEATWKKEALLPGGGPRPLAEKRKA